MQGDTIECLSACDLLSTNQSRNELVNINEVHITQYINYYMYILQFVVCKFWLYEIVMLAEPLLVDFVFKQPDL